MTTSKFSDHQTFHRLFAALPPGSTVATTGSGGGLVEPDALLALIEECFLAEGTPRDLTFIHALGLGDGETRGTNRLAHEGLVRRVIGGHWTWSPRMLELVRSNRIEAYAWPSGVIVHLLREIGAGRPGLITKVGLGTYVDPRITGGRSSQRTTEELVELIELDGQQYLRYRPFKVDLALVRGTYADEFGNIYSSEEAADLDGYEVALAASNSGGQVFAQVREVRCSSELRAREVLVPGQLVSKILVVPAQEQTYAGGYRRSLAGLRGDETIAIDQDEPITDTARLVIARRAALELRRGAKLNFGFGMSSDVSSYIDVNAEPGEFWISVEQGLHNGRLLNGNLFGISENPSAITSSAQQFDFYSGSGLDLTFLGMGELDADGNVNVSHLGDRLAGPGGFIDISQGAKNVVFCGRFNSGGTELRFRDSRLQIIQEGRRPKAVSKVQAITFSGSEALARGQRVTYVTERAVFELTSSGVTLTEYAPGLRLEEDILSLMEFRPHVITPRTMPANCFEDVAIVEPAQ